MLHAGTSPIEIRFDDGLWCYCLGSALGRAAELLTERDARWVLGRWLAREPWRGQLQRFAAAELRTEARTDEGLVERVLALLEMRGVRLWRLPRMGIAEMLELEVAEAESLVTEHEDETHWIHVVVVDEDDKPMPGVRYRIELTDGRVREGKTDANGGLYFDEMPAGDCKLSLIEHDESVWEATA